LCLRRLAFLLVKAARPCFHHAEKFKDLEKPMPSTAKNNAAEFVEAFQAAFKAGSR
jgi:hypothetical protein